MWLVTKLAQWLSRCVAVTTYFNGHEHIALLFEYLSSGYMAFTFFISLLPSRPTYSQQDLHCGCCMLLYLLMLPLFPSLSILLSLCFSATGIHTDSDPLAGVLGLDITLGSFYDLLVTQFAPCASAR